MLWPLILLPSSFIIHRNKRPPLTFSILCKFFFLSLAGITVMQNCVFTGVSYSSPTLASALSNLVPAFTFSLAVIFRMEKLDLRNSKTKEDGESQEDDVDRLQSSSKKTPLLESHIHV